MHRGISSGEKKKNPCPPGGGETSTRLNLSLSGIVSIRWVRRERDTRFVVIEFARKT